MPATFTASIDSADYLYPPLIGGSSGGEVKGLLNLGVYATNGIAVTGATFLSSATTLVELVFSATSAGGQISMALNAAGTKVVARNMSGTEIANGTDLSNASYSCRVAANVS